MAKLPLWLEPMISTTPIARRYGITPATVIREIHLAESLGEIEPLRTASNRYLLSFRDARVIDRRFHRTAQPSQ